MYDFTCNNAWALIAKRGNLRKSDLEIVRTSTFRGEAAWTNGFFLEVCELPAALAKRAGKVVELPTFDTLVNPNDNYPYEVTQAIYWEDGDAQRCILATEYGDAWNAVDPKYVGYFLKRYKDAKFRLCENEHKAVYVSSGKRLVGVIMPMHMVAAPESNMEEMLIDYSLPNERRTDMQCRELSSHMQYHNGASCAWQATQPQAIAPAMHGPAFVPKPRVRWSWVGYCSPMQYADGARCPISIRRAAETIIRDEPTIEAVTHAQSGIDKPAPKQPTPITRTPRYTPRVGDTVFVVLRHENGTTTDRVVTIQRTAKDGHAFRGFDRRYNRVRNFSAEHIAHIELWDGGSIYDRDGKEVVLAA